MLSGFGGTLGNCSAASATAISWAKPSLSPWAEPSLGTAAKAAHDEMWSAWAAPHIDSSEDSTGEEVVEQPVSSWAAYAAVADESASAEESDGSAQEVGVAEEAAIEKEVRPKPLSIYQAFRGVKSVLAPRLSTTSPQTAWPTIPQTSRIRGL